MRLLYDQDDVVARWYSQETDSPFVPAHAALGILDGEEIVGAIMLQVRNPYTCSLDVYNFAKPPLGLYRQMFEWAFKFCYRLEVTTGRDNKKMKKQLPRIGFKYECVVKHRYGKGVHGVQYYMTRDDCRWLNGRIERRQHADSAEGAKKELHHADQSGHPG